MESDVIIIVQIRGEEHYVGIDRQKAKLVIVSEKENARRFDPGTACVACDVLRTRMSTQGLRLESV